MRSTTLRFGISIATLFLPWILKRFILKTILGYKLHPRARIGFSIVSATVLRMEEGAHIGHFTVCRHLERLELDSHAWIGNLNWITGNSASPLPRAESANSGEVALLLGAHSAITNRHYIDCSDRIEIGAFTTIAGIRSTLLTHSINLERSVQEARPVFVGEYCFVGTNCILLPGSKLPSYSVLAAGSLLRGKFTEEWMLYVGRPAAPQKCLPKTYAYFQRTTGFVG